MEFPNRSSVFLCILEFMYRQTFGNNYCFNKKTNQAFTEDLLSHSKRKDFDARSGCCTALAPLLRSAHKSPIKNNFKSGTLACMK